MTSFIDWIIPRKTDSSRKLKRGEVKSLLLDEAARVCSDFEFLHYRNTLYSFQRIRALQKHDVFELIHVGFSLRSGVMNCSIASTLNRELVNRHHYGSGLVNCYWNIAGLKWQKQAVSVDKTFYYHNGRLETTVHVIAQMFDDIKRFGLPRLAAQFDKLEASKILQKGHDYINQLTEDRTLLKQQLENELNENSHYIALKKYLQSIPGQSREDRKLIPRAAFDLLQLYYSSNNEHAD